MQSDRFFNALKGHGALCRLVILPFESHGYTARESIMHVLWETDRWLHNYCTANSEDDNAESNSRKESECKAVGGAEGVKEFDDEDVIGLYHSRRRSLLW